MSVSCPISESNILSGMSPSKDQLRLFEKISKNIETIRDPNLPLRLEILLTKKQQAKPLSIHYVEGLKAQSYDTIKACFIVRDADYQETLDIIKSKTKLEHIKIVKFSEFNTLYKAESQRKALGRDHDIFFADIRVSRILHKKLGNVFYKVLKKAPHVYKPEELTVLVEKAVNSVSFTMTNKASVGVNLGKLRDIEMNQVVSVLKYFENTFEKSDCGHVILGAKIVFHDLKQNLQTIPIYATGI